MPSQAHATLIPVNNRMFLRPKTIRNKPAALKAALEGGEGALMETFI